MVGNLRLPVVLLLASWPARRRGEHPPQRHSRAAALVSRVRAGRIGWRLFRRRRGHWFRRWQRLAAGGAGDTPPLLTIAAGLRVVDRASATAPAAAATGAVRGASAAATVEALLHPAHEALTLAAAGKLGDSLHEGRHSCRLPGNCRFTQSRFSTRRSGGRIHPAVGRSARSPGSVSAAPTRATYSPSSSSRPRAARRLLGVSFYEPQGKECRVCTPPLRGSDARLRGDHPDGARRRGARRRLA
jgi:hypothetical protein